MVDRNNAGRLGAGVISVCFKTRWLGQKRDFHVPEFYCSRIHLQNEEDFDWFLLVRYTYDKITSAIGCSQEAYIDHLLV